MSVSMMKKSRGGTLLGWLMVVLLIGIAWTVATKMYRVGGGDSAEDATAPPDAAAPHPEPMSNP